MKPLVLYHASCADGFGAAFAAWKSLGDDAEYVPVQYGQVNTPDDFDMKVSLAAKGNEVYILDFSFPREVMEALFATANRVVWLDHHKTAFQMWCERERNRWEEGIGCLTKNQCHYILLDNNKSGAMLTWEYFHPGTKVPMLIKHIDDRDRWQWKLDYTREFSEALNSYPYSFECWNMLLDETGYTTSGGLEGYDRFIEEGAAILRASKQRIDKAVNGELRKIVLWRPCVVPWTEPEKEYCNYIERNEDVGKSYCAIGLGLNTTNDISEIGNAVAKKSGTFSLSFFIKGDEAICSLRSIAPFDVSVIAKYYGGGGHAQAAGFKMTIERFFKEVWR